MIALLFLLACPLPGQTRPAPPSGQSEDSLIKEALADYQSGRLDAAIAKLRQAHKTAPDNAFARLYLGLLLYQKDSTNLEAQNLMESVLDRFSTNPDLILRLADSYLSSRKEAKLGSLLEKSQKARAANRRLALNVIYLLVRHDQLQPARRELDELSAAPQAAAQETQAERKPPPDSSRAQDLGEIAFIRGLIAAASSRKEEALQQFQAADRSEFPPQNSPQMRMLAEALYRLEEFRLSAQAYQVYLSHFPQDNDARMQLALDYLALPSFNRAQEQLQQLLVQAPATPQANYYLGLVFIELKKNEEARQYFERELKLDPRSYQAMAQLALLAYLQGDDERCREWLEKAAARNQDWADTLYVYGLLYNRQGKYQEAIGNLEKVVSQSPKNMKAQLQLSIAYLRSGDEARANEHREIYERLMNEHKMKSLMEDARRK